MYYSLFNFLNILYKISSYAHNSNIMKKLGGKMKATGVVRRIDDLGRIVIPKEIRKQLMLKEGESVSFAVEHNHIVLTKFSILHKLSPTIQILLERLYSKYHNTFLLCDKRCIVVCSSDGLAKYQRRDLTKDFLLLLDQKEQHIETTMEFYGKQEQVTIYPLLCEQEIQGALIMLSHQTPYYLMDQTLLDFVKDIIEEEIESCV